MALRTWFLPLFLGLCIVLGGASAAGYLANLTLQVIAIAIAMWVVSVPTHGSVSPDERNFRYFLFTAVALFAIQFVPLPSAIWDLMGQRAAVVSTANEIGVTPNIKLVSLTPHQTLHSAVWLLPALTLALFMLRQRHYRRDLIPWAILAITVVSIVISALQVTGSPDGPLYFYDFTNPGSTVGFFANSNHQTTLLLIALPFLAAALSPFLHKNSLFKIGMCFGGLGILVLLLMGIFINRSLAGHILALPVLAASVLILVPNVLFRRLSAVLLGLTVVAGASMALLADDGAQMLSQSSSLSPKGREVIFANTWRAALDFMPFGSGIGSFQSVYPLYENQSDAEPAFINHAHNDYLELFLETGLLGALVFSLFLLWWIRQATRIWGAVSLDPLAGAAVIATAVVLVHSLVDYPLRTVAISSLFILSCVLMSSWVPAKQFNKTDGSGA